MTLRRERFDFEAALDALAAEFPERWKFISDMRLYSAIGRDRRKLRFASYALPVVAELREQCEGFAQLERAVARR